MSFNTRIYRLPSKPRIILFTLIGFRIFYIALATWLFSYYFGLLWTVLIDVLILFGLWQVRPWVTPLIIIQLPLWLFLVLYFVYADVSSFSQSLEVLSAIFMLIPILFIIVQVMLFKRVRSTFLSIERTNNGS